MSAFSRIARQVGRIFPARGPQVEPQDRSDWVQIVQGYLGSSLWESLKTAGVTAGAGSANGPILGPVPQDEIWVLVGLAFICDDTGVSRVYTIRDYPPNSLVPIAIAERTVTTVSASFIYPFWTSPARYVLCPGHTLYFYMDAITALKTFTGYSAYVPLKIGETLEP